LSAGAARSDENTPKTFPPLPGELPGKMPLRKSAEKLNQRRVDTLVLWSAEIGYVIRDNGARGLELHKGKTRTTFHFYEERRVGHGERVYTSKVIGNAAKMPLAEARKIARRLAGRDRAEPGKRKAVKFAEAFKDYLDYLKLKRSARWAYNVEGLGKLYLTPKWSKWSLAEMSASPKAVKEWHKALTAKAGSTSANHAARVLRATYRSAKKENRDLPPHDPTSAVVWNDIEPRQAGMLPKQFPKWRAKWREIESPTRRAFALLGLLTGIRPGALSRLKWSDIDCRSRSITIRSDKTGAGLVPMSWPIASALRMARDGTAHASTPLASGRGESEWVFPARGSSGHLMQFAEPTLPAFGHALRHVFKDAALAVGVDDFQSRLLMSHSLRGVSAEYLTKAVISSGPSLRASQAKISRRIIMLLDPAVKAPALSPEQDADTALLPALP
jgi:integrase